MALIRTKGVYLIENAGPLKRKFWWTVEHDVLFGKLSSIEFEICTNVLLNKFISAVGFFFFSNTFRMFFSLVYNNVNVNFYEVNFYFKTKLKKFVHSENRSLIRLFRAQLSLIRGEFERTIVWSEVILSTQSSGRWSGFGPGQGRTIVRTQLSDFPLIRRHFTMERSDQRQFRAHLERTQCFERTLVWSEDTLIWDGLIRGCFRLVRSDVRSLPDGTSTWAGCPPHGKSGNHTMSYMRPGNQTMSYMRPSNHTRS